MKGLRGGWFAIRGVWTPASKPELRRAAPPFRAV